MPQQNEWEKEYRNPQLVSKEDKPQADVMDFLRFLRKEQKIAFEGLNVLDLGCGTGRNANHLAELGAKVTGYEISDTALNIAKERAKEKKLVVEYRNQNMGAKLPLEDKSIDLILDVMSSNSLSENERKIYIDECARVLRPGSWLFVRTLCKDGDENAKYLLKTNPGKENDTYVMPGMNLIERVISKEDFNALYSPHFEIKKLEKKTNYPRMNGRVYKRNYWLAYLKLRTSA